MESNTSFIPPAALNTAVLFIVFNRLDTTRKVFQSIRSAKPPRLYVAADGARESREGEADKVQAVRNFILDNVDWDCDIKTLFRDKNIGCGAAVSGAITWFFEQEEMGIILEDDCLPSQSFYWYAEEALKKFKDHEDIYGITGDYRAPVNPAIAQNISLISFPLIWGWATWRRVWKQYDRSMKDWSGNINDIPLLQRASKETRRYFQRAFSKTAKGEINTWDYQFSYQILKRNAKFITPNKNMISNIGYGEGSTHLVNFDPVNNAVPVHEIAVDLSTFVDNNYDSWLCDHAFNRKSVSTRAFNKLLRVTFKK
ncbi:nucleotide-diphospho-sugar transferase [Pontibacter locisalis]|uniref:Nucleotide-diphospho-sugar transferase n=1 Tax=Pontibacter locisalis TaxID=1719035 RepID=A0ABW5IHB4_9BACT